jgi:MOSC domain-containing protein YiiM
MSKLNLAGDRQADLTVHGGAEKAVYAYPTEHYEYWRKTLPEVPFSWGREPNDRKANRGRALYR